jgi:UDP-glucose 4-epimerase
LSISNQIDYVVHYAAAISVPESMRDPAKYDRINVAGSRNIFQWAAIHQIKRVVAASSAAVYGIPTVKYSSSIYLIRKALPLSESSDTNPISPYATTKLDMEKLMEFYNKLYNKTDFIALRFFNVYGPRQDPKSSYSGVVSKFMQKAHEGSNIIINGDGYHTRDFVYVQDVARATILAMKKGEGFEVYNVGTENHVTMNDLASLVIEVRDL